MNIELGIPHEERGGLRDHRQIRLLVTTMNSCVGRSAGDSDSDFAAAASGSLQSYARAGLPSMGMFIRRAVLSQQLVGHRGEDHVRLEEQEPLHVERLLVVQQATPTAGEEFRHQYEHLCAFLCGQVAEVLEERVADVAVGGVDDLESDSRVGCVNSVPRLGRACRP
jgi:hypothetical protein